MVGPMSDEERRAGSQRLYTGFVVLVGLSAGIMALSGGATLSQAALVTGAGLVLGGALVWWLVRIV
ncbi:hypothetical protein [Halalkalicoccus subterraneus]|uniref:hypothetical protein n=1 Tax=Halalkalicoccus subterraneus TaxID=2675002 RepID=UPI000EFCB806|nr:hypothetical protein [Halalkalicoccus subterraneus]